MIAVIFTENMENIRQQIKANAENDNRSFINTVDILLALIQESDCAAAHTFSNLEISEEMLRKKKLQYQGPEETASSENQGKFSSQAASIYRHAQGQLKTAEDDMESEHILLAILNDPTSMASQLLTACCLELEIKEGLSGIKQELDEFFGR